MAYKIRVLLAKPGLDGHEAGVLLVARALRDAGMEVIYLGTRQSPAAIARIAAHEDPNVIGLSVLTGGHLTHCQRVLDALRDIGAGDIPVVIGGIISPTDAHRLRAMGIEDVFGPGEPLGDIVARIKQIAVARNLHAESENDVRLR